MKEKLIIPSALLGTASDALWVYCQLAARADEHGHARVCVRSLWKEIGVSYQKLRTLINYLRITHLLTQETTHGETIITLCQHDGCGDDVSAEKRTQQRSSQRGVADVTSSVTSSNGTQRFVRPTIEELRAYIAEKGYSIDAEYFFNHYESVGWMRGKTKMKSWKATLATWNKNQYGTKQTPAATETQSRYSGIKQTAEAMLRCTENLDALLDDPR